ncbi:signal peptide peptidase SppA [Urechidicola vernalis]|uniref:Signal peptide peptidase SppA n=1 Tax=Urechidicola vernalis TaxID=3075600 RepID=A0ABU2Y4K1_9FLAO|nr:signal peptide peptidase SppA [Urechidicola sp. P050]MDT0553117.1 signal peptide peptidase SppA [Urechidicola sp. P050]
MKFFRSLLTSCLGSFIALFVIFGLGFLMLIWMISTTSESEKVVVKTNSVLVLNLEDGVADYVPSTNNPFETLFPVKTLQLSKIINAIESAKQDDNIKGISISNGLVNAGISQTQSIRNKIEEFKQAGKFVTSYANIYTQKNYYLSSVADSLYVTPTGIVDFRGLSTERLFYKDFQEKYGVKMEVIRHGKYKSAVEGYLDNKMSAANREQISSFLHSIWGEFLEDIGASRGLTIEDLNNIADELLTRTTELAVEFDMINAAIYKDKYEEIVDELVGAKTNYVSISDYISSGKGRIRSTASNRIAVLYAQGTMLYGKGDETVIGQESMIKAIRKIKKDKKIKAVVLRVNSPGGVALTGDLIWRELELLKQEKPFVVSMGDMAASGGYYIAAGAQMIYAEPTTITGSIGVFGTIPNLSGLVDNIGINAEQVATNKQAMGYSFYEPMTNDFYNERKEGVELIYKTFVNRVADGRNMTFKEVDAVAQGRVWTGKEAIENGLVDELGSLNDAIDKASELANISEYRITEYPKFQKDFEDSFNLIPFAKLKENYIKNELGETNFKIYKEMKNFSQYDGIQALVPYSIDIK